MKLIPLLFTFAAVASASAHPRVIGHVAPEDLAGITAAISSDTQDRIVEVRVASVADRVGVQTESGPSAGCRYLVQRTNGVWKILGKSCWTRTTRLSQEDTEQRRPRVTRPSQVSERDFTEIIAAVRAVTSEPILAIDTVTVSKPVTEAIARKATTVDILGPGRTRMREIVVYDRTDQVGVSTGDYRNLKGDSYLVVKRGATWKVEKKSFWIH